MAMRGAKGGNSWEKSIKKDENRMAPIVAKRDFIFMFLCHSYVNIGNDNYVFSGH